MAGNSELNLYLHGIKPGGLWWLITRWLSMMGGVLPCLDSSRGWVWCVGGRKEAGWLAVLTVPRRFLFAAIGAGSRQ